MITVLTHFPQSRPGAIAVTALCALVIEALIAWVVWQDRREAVADGHRNALRMVQLLAEQTNSAFRTADLVLLNIKYSIEHGPALAANETKLHERLRTRVADLPHVRAFFVIAADGFITHDSDYPATPRRNLADRDYFAVHAKDAGLGTYVGRPLESLSVDKWFVPVSRRIERDGTFQGVVVAAVEPKFFEDFYRALALGPRDAVALFNTDSTLIARFPDAPGVVGKPWPQLDLFKERLPAAPVGTFSSDGFQHGRGIISYRALSPLPLVTTVVLNEGWLLAGWWRSALAWGVAAVVAPVLLFLLMALLEQHRFERQAALKRALKAQKLEALGQMTGGIAHDFNNMLAVVGASFRLMRRNGAGEQYMAAGEQALERGARLTSQLLSFAKGQELSRTLEDANELLRSLQPMLKQAVGAGVRVSYQLDPKILPCFVDRAQFDSAIINLVVNAAQAMQGGDISISTEAVTIRTRQTNGLRRGRYVSLRVKDGGCGIPPAELKRVFEPFYTTKKDTGTGLGLAQVSAFMHRIGGDARIESQLGVGTTVELLFPCSEPPAVPQIHQIHKMA